MKGIRQGLRRTVYQNEKKKWGFERMVEQELIKECKKKMGVETNKQKKRFEGTVDQEFIEE